MIKKLATKLAMKWAIPLIVNIIAGYLSSERVEAVKHRLVEIIKNFFAKVKLDIPGIPRDKLLEPLLKKLDELDLSKEDYRKALDKLFTVIEDAVKKSTLEIGGISDDELVLPVIAQLRKKLGV